MSSGSRYNQNSFCTFLDIVSQLNRHTSRCVSLAQMKTDTNIFLVPKTTPSKSHFKSITNREKSRLSHERSHKIRNKYRRLSNRNKQGENQTTTSNEYDAFEREIENKENCRSTLFDVDQNSSMTGVLPLPLTPVRPKPPSNCTPKGNSTKQGTPITASKLSAAPLRKNLHF